MKLGNANLWNFALVGIIAICAGCAVMTVDVDVYKGSLANHEEVQLEQLAAMPIGAKPLLIHLRDQLELETRKHLEKQRDTPENLRELYFSRVGAKEVFKHEYMDPYKFLSASAFSVNEVLGLYEDQKMIETLANRLSEVERLVKRYIEEFTRSSTNQYATEIWNQLRTQTVNKERQTGSGLLDAIKTAVNERIEKIKVESDTTKKEEERLKRSLATARTAQSDLEARIGSARKESNLAAANTTKLKKEIEELNTNDRMVNQESSKADVRQQIEEAQRAVTNTKEAYQAVGNRNFITALTV